ncbi:MAG TPA: tetratricopeptide repeat protein [Bryobacteraceae bacterium]|nr:tetratricopeptide repeat protein [Bryobacteraceae bacterium]HTF61758.1 tetratricopeptide repeat protein [Edaphobacter sp.]
MNAAKLTVIVWALHLTSVVLRPQDVPSKEALAQQAVTAHRFAEARDLYVSLTENHPENASYWAARGRVSGYLGDYPGALAAYDRALAIDPKNVDTMVGKAYVLLWQQNFPSATALLNEAQALAPESAEVDLAIAQENYYRHRPKEALTGLQKILRRNPQDASALELKSRLRSERQIRIELGIIGDSLSVGLNGVSGLVDVGLVSPNNFISVRYEDWLRFGQRVIKGGATFSHTFPHFWTVDASTVIGSRGDVLARYDDSIGLKHRFRTGWAASTTYRDLLFDRAHVRLVSPSLEYSFEKPISLQATYTRGWNTYSSLLQLGQPTNSVLLRYNQTFKKVTVHGGWSKGVELFAIPVVNQLGQFHANTYIAGIDIPISKILTTKFEYAFQRRNSGVSEQVYSARLVFQR